MNNEKADEYTAQLERIIALIPGNVYWKDKNGKYLGCNENMAKILQLSSPSAIVGKTIFDLANKKLAAEIEAIDKEVIKTNAGQILEEKGINYNGNPANYISQKIPLHDAKGEAIGLIGISFEITEKKEAEENLRKAHEQFNNSYHSVHLKRILYLENIFSLLPGTVYWIDINGNVLGCNANQSKIFNLKKKLLIGKNIFQICKLRNLDKNIAESVHQNNLEVINQKKTLQFEEILILNNKQKKLYLTCKNPIIDEANEIIGITGISIEASKFVNYKNSEVLLERTNNLIHNKGNDSKLSKREKETLYYLTRGMSSKEIAKTLALSPRTIEYYIEILKTKLRCYSRSELIEKALQLGLINLQLHFSTLTTKNYLSKSTD